MEKNISAELPGQFPFDILIRSKEGKFARTKALNDRNLKLGICIQNRAWLLVRLPTDQSAPEKFLQTLKDITGLPLLYPEHEDFQHLREAYPKAQNVFDLLIQAENLNAAAKVWHVFPMMKKRYKMLIFKNRRKSAAISVLS